MCCPSPPAWLPLPGIKVLVALIDVCGSGTDTTVDTVAGSVYRWGWLHCDSGCVLSCPCATRWQGSVCVWGG